MQAMEPGASSPCAWPTSPKEAGNDVARRGGGHRPGHSRGTSSAPSSIPSCPPSRTAPGSASRSAGGSPTRITPGSDARNNVGRSGCTFTVEFPVPVEPTRPRRPVKTVLLVSASETLRPQAAARPGGHLGVHRRLRRGGAADPAPHRDGADRQGGQSRPPGICTTFIASARAPLPERRGGVMLTPEPTPDDESAAEAADFVLLQPFTTPASAETCLSRPKTSSAFSRRWPRCAPRGRPAADGRAREPRRSARAPRMPSTQMAKEFAKALAAGFDLPRVLDQFLDGVARDGAPEPERASCSPTRRATTTGSPPIAASRRTSSKSLTLAADSGLPLLAGHRGPAHPASSEAQSRSADAGRPGDRARAGRPAIGGGHPAELARRAGRHPHPRSAHQRRRVWTERDRDPVQPRDPPGHRDPRDPRAPPAPVREGFQRADPRPHVERRDHHRSRREGGGRSTAARRRSSGCPRERS